MGAASAVVVSLLLPSPRHLLLRSPRRLLLHRHLRLARVQAETQPKSTIATTRAARLARRPIVKSAAMVAISRRIPAKELTAWRTRRCSQSDHDAQIGLHII